MVGSSTTSGGNASGRSGSQSVSEIAGRSMPAKATMSPAPASSTSVRSRPRKLALDDALVRAWPWRSTTVTSCPSDRAPLDAADAIAPRSSSSRAGRPAAAAARRSRVRRRAVRHDRLEQRGHVAAAVRGVERGEALDRRGVHDGEIELRLGGAERSNRSKVWSSTQLGRASAGRSCDHHDRPQAVREGLLRHEAVCGIGPSTASTSSSTESTIDSTRSTSPPKSAWPGVSTMLMRQSRQRSACSSRGW